MPLAVGLLLCADTEVRQPLADGLRNQQMQVVEAASPEEAFQLAQFGRLQFVVADDDGEGVTEMCRQLRASPFTTALLIILVSGVARDAHALRVIGVDAQLTKPTDVDAIAATITRELRHQCA